MDVLALLLALVLVALNGFFVATEFAIVKIRPTRVEELVSSGRVGATTVKKIVSHLDGYLSATQLGITLASLGLGWIGEPAVAGLIGPPLRLMGLSDPDIIHGISLVTAFAVITFLHIVAGELAPKSLAILRPDTVAMSVALPMRLFYIVFYPAIWALNSVAALLLRSLGVQLTGEGPDHHSESELRIILAQARRSGHISAPRGDVVKKALALSAKTARHVMVPRSDVVLLDTNLSLADNLARARSSGHRRFPLCARELDEVIGIVDIQDVLFALTEGDVELESFAADTIYLPEAMPAERLLVEFKKRYVPMAVIVDEYGGAAGIVTPVDVMEAVAGDMYSEGDGEMKALPGGDYDVDGSIPLEELEERLKLSLASEGMRTLSGFLMLQLGRMPTTGDRVVFAGHSFSVMEVIGPKIRRVRIRRDRLDVGEEGEGRAPNTPAPTAPTAAPVAAKASIAASAGMGPDPEEPSPSGIPPS